MQKRATQDFLSEKCLAVLLDFQSFTNFVSDRLHSLIQCVSRRTQHVLKSINSSLELAGAVLAFQVVKLAKVSKVFVTRFQLVPLIR